MIRFENVTKRYPRQSRPALEEIDLNIERGEFVFLVGASGSGKSSFLRLVLKEDRPTKGRIHVLGQDLGRIPNRKVPFFRRNIGVVFQDFRLLPDKTAAENVAYVMHVLGASPATVRIEVPATMRVNGTSATSRMMKGNERTVLTNQFRIRNAGRLASDWPGPTSCEPFPL